MSLKFSFDKLTKDRFRDFLKFKGWIESGNWQNKIIYFSYPDYRETIRLYVWDGFKGQSDKLKESFYDLVRLEKIDTVVMENQYVEFLAKLGTEKILSTVVSEIVEATKKSEDREKDGKFAKGNKIAGEASIIGVSSLSIRRHRSFINENAPDLLKMLMEESLKRNNTQIAMWLIGRIMPETKASSYSHVTPINSIATLKELKEQSAKVVIDSMQGDISLEDGNALMGMYKDHKLMIEASEVEPLAMEIAKRMGKTYG